MSILPDILVENLRVVFCGTAVSSQSAAVQAYYASRNNKFWGVLHEIGLTPVQLRPAEYPRLLQYRIGLTDLAKLKSGSDSVLQKDDFDRDGLREKMKRFQPRYLCFNGKTAAKQFLDRKHVSYGLQNQQIGATRLFVAPSTSGAANGYWDASIWQDLADLIQVP